MTLYASKIFKNQLNISELANIVPVYLICIQSLLRVAIMIYKKKEIESFINDLGVIWRKSDRNFQQIEKKRRLVKQLKFWQTMYYWIDISGSWEYVFAPLVSTIIRIFILKQNFAFALPVGCVYPFDPTSDWFKYLATYAFQAINVLRYSWFYIGIEYMMVSLCADLAIEFSILREDLLRVKPNLMNPELQLSSETDSGDYERVSIQDFIRRHQKLISLADILDDVFNKIVFVHIVIVTITVGFFAFATTVGTGMVGKANNIVGSVAILSTAYVVCYYGEMLKDEVFKEEVNAFEVAYMIPVYLVSVQVFYWSNILGTWLHLLGPLTSVLFRRFILGQYCELVLPFGSVYPYEPSDSWFKYLATYAFQVYTMSCEVYAYVGTEFLMIALCANIAIEFSILREDLLHVAPHFKTDNPRNQMGIGLETNSESNTTTSIQDFIRRHQMLIRLAKQLDDIFNKIIFINLLFVTATLCFFGFATTVARGAVETMNNLVAVLALLLPTYTFCYYGELLKDESSGIAESAYFNEWYKGNICYQRMINFIIARSQRPCCLTSLRHVPVTMNMFTKVLSTTWSYFSLATSIYSRGIAHAGKKD
ncbi:uncharacterized protein LOC106708377 [Papilio machaon]|uniref:uncharacterized protein LOC106708377 n=1 Tax=Papilio machaon TaxID=76193 RepID=UPI001E664BFA|nr:uncharacterized protein LOC106708377 [Papilio machaon]